MATGAAGDDDGFTVLNDFATVSADRKMRWLSCELCFCKGVKDDVCVQVSRI